MDLRTKLSEQYDQVKRTSIQLQSLATKTLQRGMAEDGIRQILKTELGTLRASLHEYFRVREELVRAKLTAQPQALVERVLSFFRQHESLLQEIRTLQERTGEDDLEDLGARVMETLCHVTENEIGERTLIYRFEAA